MERLIDSDEGLLALDGIGPKALAEIKTQLEATVPAAPEEPEPEIVAAAEAELVVEPEPILEEAVVEVETVSEIAEIDEAAAVVTPEELIPDSAIEEAAPVAEAPVHVEPEPPTAPEPEPVPEIDDAQRQAEREAALARIPADAYDIPLAVLALSGRVLSPLRNAQIENLGQIMERLADGDQGLLAIDGIDANAVDEIKMQVEIMVSVPTAKEPTAAEKLAAAEARDGGRFPRFEYVADDELEELEKPRRRRRQKQRRPMYDQEWEEAPAGETPGRGYQDWEEFEE
jgi:hypothetical protein